MSTLTSSIAAFKDLREWAGRTCTTQEQAMRASLAIINSGPAIAFLEQLAANEPTQLRNIDSDRRKA